MGFGVWGGGCGVWGVGCGVWGVESEVWGRGFETETVVNNMRHTCTARENLREASLRP